MQQHPSLAGYAPNAAKLVQEYESRPFETVFTGFLHVFPTVPSRILDIGAGSGRNAAALARKGHHVVAVEPVKEMREAGMRLHADVPLTWVDDMLPSLASLREGPHAGPYDCVLLAAVMMHFTAEEREAIMGAVAPLLRGGGRLIVTFRHGPVPEGRRMFEVSLEEAAALGERHGFTLTDSREHEDHAGRPGVSWTMVCMVKQLR